MTEHDTTDYVATIKGAVAFLRTKTTAYQLDVIDRFTDALAARLAAAEAERDAERERAERFKALYRTLDSDASMSDWIDRVMEAKRVLQEHGDVPTTDGSDDDA